jgi:hypothetical protein
MNAVTGDRVATSEGVGERTPGAHPSSSDRFRRAPRGARIFGYLVAGVIQFVLIWAVNVTPGWRAVPFLTEDAGALLGLVNLSLFAGLVVNVGYVLYDAPWVRRVGEAATTGISLVVMVRLLQIFPFDFSGGWSGWPSVARVLLVLGIVGCGIAIVVNLVQGKRSLGGAGGV